jgi:hypothetical protein
VLCCIVVWCECGSVSYYEFYKFDLLPVASDDTVHSKTNDAPL